MKNKRSILLIGLGSMNFLHGVMHLLQFVQSIILVSKSAQPGDDNPIWALIWAIVGIITLIVGIKDFIHHKNCGDDKEHSH